ncbi:S-adenosyl-L-methionine dependent methyltransferase [Xylona heveae TC161]|uniref:S-adenosyl-L-methionine dependent methyltransferase n=1 Tax=Xylona heveae (strain CBS 132557 / TC161) TaxID=1328760 RepID=A0A165IT06_XYLHT|nr:S-adenosyl-L-methionine dependent methyltransferase [Xylona heveae TC161]KZF25344.1 S-adenosyl-L-methionine dependent methyltransferase [Xylona heveae TC161]
MDQKLAGVQTSAAAKRGAACYESWIMYIYDFFVLGFINSFAWRCPTNKHLLPLFKNNIRTTHLDIGVGTGYYLKNSNVAPSVQLTLSDLSPNAIRVAKLRSGRHDATEILWDVTQPFPLSEGKYDKFDSVSMFYVLHCVPGPVKNKVVVFENLKSCMTVDGVLTGATVLGKGIEDNFLGRRIRAHCVANGVFDNVDDDAETFINALRSNFHEVEVELIGVSLVFKAMRPRSD